MRNAIGISLTEKSVQSGVIREDGNIHFRNSLLLGNFISRDELIENIIQSVKDALSWSEGQGFEITGAGIGTPGIVDNGLILGKALSLPEWDNLPLEGMLSRKFTFPVFVEKDKNLEGLAETIFGSAIGTRDVVYIHIGQVISGTLIISGSIYGGHRNRGAELGHIIVEINGKKCRCGAAGCIEAYASSDVLIDNYDKLRKGKFVASGTERSDIRQIAENYLLKEKAAVQTINTHFDYLSAAIAGLINLLSPQKVILGGELPCSCTFYVENIRERVFSMAMKETSVFTGIETARLGEDAGILGAAALVFEKVQ